MRSYEFEIEMLAVGNVDAIIFGYFFDGTEKVVVIDGGSPEDVDRIVERIRTHPIVCDVDLLICTHPDKDNMGGLHNITCGAYLGS